MSIEFKGELPSSEFVKGLIQSEGFVPSLPYIEWSNDFKYRGELLIATLSTPRIYNDGDFDQARSVLMTIHRVEPEVGFEVWVVVETPGVYFLRLEAAAFSRIIAPVLGDLEADNLNDSHKREALRLLYTVPRNPGRVFADGVNIAHSHFNPRMFESVQAGIDSLTEFTEAIRQAAWER